MPSTTTQLTDIFVGDYYQTLDPVNSPEKTAVYQSGIVVKNEALDAIANNGQGSSTIAYWQDLDADEAPNLSNDDPDDLGEVGKAAQGSMQARTLYLNKGYGVADLTAELANSEPMQHIRNRFGKYWERQWQRYLLGSARGVIASNIANDGGDMVIDAGATISAGAFQDAAFTAGDTADQFSAMGVHSVVMNLMVKVHLKFLLSLNVSRQVVTVVVLKSCGNVRPICCNLQVSLGRVIPVQTPLRLLRSMLMLQTGSVYLIVSRFHLLRLSPAQQHLNKHGDFGRLCFGA